MSNATVDYQDVVNPATGQTIGQVKAFQHDEIDAIIRQAHHAQPSWEATPRHARAAIVQKFADMMQADRERLGATLQKETGKLQATALGEIDSATRVTRGYAAALGQIHGDSTRLEGQAGYERDWLLSEYEALGVAVAIAPFNFPIALMIHKVIPALLMGNSVVVKPAEGTPLATVEVIALLNKAGVPPETLTVVTGSGRVIGDSLTGHALVNKISFTGSAAVGRRVGRMAMESFARVTLELGGNDAAVVFDDANLELAVDRIATTRFANAGQVCCSNKRVLVQRSVYDEFREMMIQKVSKLRIGDPLAGDSDLGPLVSISAAAGVHDQVQRTIAAGARVLVGGESPDGAYYGPTLLDGITADMDIASDMEVFGPVLPLLPFDADDEAIQISNQSMYGLNGAVFTENISRAMSTASAMKAGTVVVNGGAYYRPDILAFGGYKASGIGREGLRDTLKACGQVKNIALRDVL